MAETRTVLDRAVGWERTAREQRWLTQPLGDGRVKTWTWGEAIDEARRVAAYLRSLDLPPRSNVALWSKNCAWWFLADLAIWMAGHVSVPVYPVLTTDTFRYVLEHSNSALLFVGKLEPDWEQMSRALPASLPRITFPLSPPSAGLRWEDLVATCAPIAEPATRSRDELATIMYTSGSTGTPKGVMLSFEALQAVAEDDTALNVNVGPEDRLLSYLPLAHSFERAFVEVPSIWRGIQVFFADSVATFLDDLRRARPTLFISVPRLWIKFQAGVFEKVPPAKLDRLLRVPFLRAVVKRKILRQLGLECVRIAGSGSAPLPAQVIAWYRRLGLELLEGYAMTENSAYSHGARPGQVRPGFVGVARPGVECRISEQGEIQVKGPGMMLGYYRDPAQTADAFTPDGFLRTGDMGFIDTDGQLCITGRVKELFKTDKGKYIAPAPIENRLLHHAAIEQCCVTGAQHPQPHALVVLSELGRRLAASGRVALERDLAAHLGAINQELPRYEQLAFMAIVEDAWLPENGFLTPTLKLKRARIEQVYGPLTEGWYAVRRPVVWQTGATAAVQHTGSVMAE